MTRPTRRAKADDDLSIWPTLLRSLAQTLGADVVYTKGLEHLGYPPTWATAAKEYAEITTILKRFGS